jgi:hypothetical protein
LKAQKLKEENLRREKENNDKAMLLEQKKYADLQSEVDG